MPTLEIGMIVKLEEALCDGCRLCPPARNFNALHWIRSDREELRSKLRGILTDVKHPQEKAIMAIAVP